MIYLPANASKSRLREAENARRTRAEFLKALADGTIRRRDLIKWGLVTEDPETFRALKAPPQRVCAAPVPVPFSPPLEQAALPDRPRIVAAIRRVLDAAPASV